MLLDLLESDALTNPETATYQAVEGIATKKWRSGAPGVLLEINAIGDSTKPRLTEAGEEWLGPATWLINPGQTPPIHMRNYDSLRRVQTVEVPFTPQLAPGKVAWWDAQSLNLADGAALSTLPDLSGNGNDLRPKLDGDGLPVPSSQPHFDIDLFGGLPAINFDGIANYLSVTLANTFTAPCVVYATAGTNLLDASSGFDWLLDGMNVGGSGSRLGIYRTTGELYGMVRGSTALTGGSWGVGPKLFRASFNDAGNSTLHVNNALVLNGPMPLSASSGLLQKLFLGCGASSNPTGLFYTGFFGEMVILKGPVPEALDTNMRNYLIAHWGLTI